MLPYYSNAVLQHYRCIYDPAKNSCHCNICLKKKVIRKVMLAFLS